MKILAVDSSAKTASAALVENEKLISECFVNAGLTHSRTLMPMIDNVLSVANVNIKEVDAFCVNSGPGSFTGIRIGVATIKGLAAAEDKPCAGISSLEATAYNFCDEDCLICVSMDARCNQVYTALFRAKNGKIQRLCEDKAVAVDELRSELSAYDEKIIFAGDGAQICFDAFASKLKNAVLAGENRRFQRAYATALAAINNNAFSSSTQLVPLYLRLPQAERELKLKKRGEEK